MSKVISTRSKVVIIIISLIIVGAATVMIVPQTRGYIMGLFGTGASKNTETEREAAERQALENSNKEGDDLGKAMFSGDTDEVAKIYDQKIASASDNNAKISAYLNKAESLGSMGDKNAALASLLEAEKVSPDSLAVVSFAANLYKELGNNKKAAEYYRKGAAITAKNPNPGGGTMTEAEYIQLAEEIGG